MEIGRGTSSCATLVLILAKCTNKSKNLLEAFVGSDSPISAHVAYNSKVQHSSRSLVQCSQTSDAMIPQQDLTLMLSEEIADADCLPLSNAFLHSELTST